MMPPTLESRESTLEVGWHGLVADTSSAMELQLELQQLQPS